MEEINPLAGKKKEIKASVTTSSLMQDESPKPDVMFSEAQLMAVKAIVDSVVQNQTESNAKLVDAIIESKRPYVDPGQEAFKRDAKESARQIEERRRQLMIRARSACAHLQGAHELSSFTSPYGLTAIIAHQLDTGEVVGLCCVCGKLWRPGDPDYSTWVIQKKSGCLPSRSGGGRWFPDPKEAVERGRLVDKE